MQQPHSLPLLIALVALAACAPAPEEGARQQAAAPTAAAESAAPVTPISQLSGDSLLARIEAGEAPLILDVRTPAEFAAGHIPGAVNIPHTEIEARMSELGDQQDREIVVHCKSGRRAGMAEEQLVAAGYTNILHLDGDMQGWEAGGRPVVAEAMP